MIITSSPVSLRRDDGIAVITIDNPPVNALSQAVRQGLAEAIESIAADSTVRGAILICAGRTFVAGADIREFGKPPAPPMLRDGVPPRADNRGTVRHGSHIPCSEPP